MTAGWWMGWMVAIKRRRPPTVWTRQHVDGEGPVHEGRPAPGARPGLFPCPVRSRGQSRRAPRRVRGVGHSASVGDHAAAPPGARGQHAVVGFGPRCDGGQAFQKFERLEDQLSRAVVPRRLHLQRDAAVAPPPRRSCAKGGRSTYRHRRSSPARSLADTHTLACRSKPSVRRPPQLGQKPRPLQEKETPPDCARHR
jgi:hypothetical protein